MWEAVRASSAAPGYFDEFQLSNKLHHDGAMICNNASILAIHESKKIWPSERVQCVVSLGTGIHDRPIAFEEENDDDMSKGGGAGGMPGGRGQMAKPKALSLVQKFSRMVDAATDTEMAHVTLRDLLPGHTYFRFNPLLSEYYPLEEHREDKMAMMHADTRMYLRRNHARVAEACKMLQQPRSMVDFASDCLRHAEMVAKGKKMFKQQT